MNEWEHDDSDDGDGEQDNIVDDLCTSHSLTTAIMSPSSTHSTPRPPTDITGLAQFALLFVAPLLAAATRSATRDRVQVFLHPAPDIDNDVGAPTLSSSQASAVIGHHLGADLSHSPTPHDEGMWAHLMYLWDGPQRPRVVIVEGVEPQCGYGSGEETFPSCSDSTQTFCQRRSTTRTSTSTPRTSLS